MVHIKDAMAWALREAEQAGSKGANRTADASEIVDFACLDLSRSIAEAGLRREILFVPPSMLAVDLLAKMRACRIHLALVVDEFGGTDGLVSIEDLVEEIVGDIADEHDEAEVPLGPAAGGAFEVSARAPIAEVEQVLGVPLTSGELAGGVDTLGGLILAMNGYVPKRGARIAHPSGVTFEILEATPRRIQKVRVAKPKALPPPDGDRAPQLMLRPPAADARAA
jgi:CBS domain containing-hemolysin-like protein